MNTPHHIHNFSRCLSGMLNHTRDAPRFYRYLLLHEVSDLIRFARANPEAVTQHTLQGVTIN